MDRKSVPLGFSYRGRRYGLVPATPRSMNDPLNLHGVALTNTGKQLLGIVDIEPETDAIAAYATAPKNYFASMKLTMVEVREGPADSPRA